MLTPNHLAFIEAQRLAHLATASADGEPHVVPVCFAWHGGAFWIAIDEKPKSGARLQRLRNIEQNPRVSLVFDRWDEDWSRLAHVLVRGRASVVTRGDSHPNVLAGLRARYPQYETMSLEDRPLIRVTPERVTAWGQLRE